MQLIQLLLPLYTEQGKPFPTSFYEEVKKELTHKFAGLTAYTRSPATGLWKKEEGEIIRDDIYVYEVMTDHLDKEYWTSYKLKLQQLFNQDELVIRASEMILL